MAELVDQYFWVAVRWGLLAFLIVYGKKILKAIGGSNGWDKKDVGATILMSLAIYMIYMEGQRKDLVNHIYSDWQFGIVVVSAILGFGINKILDVLAFISTKGKAPIQESQSNEDNNG